MTYEDSVCLVTGAASGIGRALASELAARGARLILADIDESGVRRTAGALPGAQGVKLDVTDAASFAYLVEHITEQQGRLDLLFNNAGTAVAGEAHDLSAAHWRRVLDVNLTGTVNGVLAAYPGMVVRGGGHIVNVASLAGLAPLPFLAPYTASKFGVVGLSLALRTEARGHGVKVTAVCPGAVETPLLDRIAPDGLPAPSSAPDVRAFLTQGSGRGYSAEAFAKTLLRGVRRNRAIVVAPARARILWRLMRVSPPVALALLAQMTAAERRRRDGAARA
jgi:NAD(P)-dependent dehydrogenase (short-subunit alcohol dehydrogenase family)